MKAYDVILKPVLTEKSYSGIQVKKYTFQVKKDANKVEIKNAVEQIFGVVVAKVNTSNRLGKFKRQGKTSGYKPDFKIAYVQLTPESKAIEFFDSLS